MDTEEALELSRSHKLDLVQIKDDSIPPLARIMDYGKFLFKKSKNFCNSKKKQVQTKVKEFKFRLNTDKNDYNFKLKSICKFLSKGNYRIKVSISLKGREFNHKHLGLSLLNSLCKDSSNHGYPESEIKFEAKNYTLVLVSNINNLKIK